ncbi:MAG TPA: hypothetical protein VMS76_11345 [Planctomycetota bacterium]|nr:hypothetical protein [Planctomycetota bacterium]
MSTLRLLPLLAVGLLFAVTPARAQAPIVKLIGEGDLLAGVGNVTSILNLTINDSGDWIVEVDTDNANTDIDGALVKNGGLHLQEGHALAAPAGASIDTFDTVSLSATGHSGWNFFLDGTTGTGDDSGIFFDDILVLQEGTISSSPGFSAGTPYIGFFECKINSANQILVVASVDDPAIATTVDRALVIMQVDGLGTLLSETVFAKEGDQLAGQVDLVSDFGTGPHNFAFNESGDIMFVADLNGLTTTDGVMYLNNTLLAQEGSPSPVAGRNWLTLSTSVRMSVNDAGDWVHTGTLDGSTADDLVIIKNGTLFRQEGEVLAAFSPFALTSFGSGPVEIDAAGNVLWFGDWNDPDTTKDTGLFLNDTLLVQEGVTMIGGVVVQSLSSVTDGYKLSPSGRYVIFEATLQNGVNGAFMIDLEGPTFYCTAKVTSSGCVPAIDFSGLPSAGAGSGFLITASQIEPQKSGLFFYGKSGPAAFPFQGGTLCVNPPQTRTPVQDSGGAALCSGTYSIDFNTHIAGGSDPALVAGQQVHGQYWFRDPGFPAPDNTGFTNAIEFTIEP